MDEMINEVQEKSSQSPRKKSLYMIYNIQSKSWANLLVLFSVELLFIHLYCSEVNGKLSWSYFKSNLIFSNMCLHVNNKGFILNIYFLVSFLLYMYYT